MLGEVKPLSRRESAGKLSTAGQAGWPWGRRCAAFLPGRAARDGTPVVRWRASHPLHRWLAAVLLTRDSASLGGPHPFIRTARGPALSGGEAAVPWVAIGSRRRGIESARRDRRHARPRPAAREYRRRHRRPHRESAVVCLGRSARGAGRPGHRRGGQDPAGRMDRSVGQRAGRRCVRHAGRVPAGDVEIGGCRAFALFSPAEYEHEKPDDDQWSPQRQEASEASGVLLRRVHRCPGMHGAGRRQGFDRRP